MGSLVVVGTCKTGLLTSGSGQRVKMKEGRCLVRDEVESRVC